MSALDYSTKKLLDAIVQRGRDLGYSENTIKRATAAAHEMNDSTGERHRAGAVVIQPVGSKAIEVWADALLDQAIRGFP